MPVYPRWRGEHLSTSVKAWSGNGLSPLARGTPSSQSISSPQYRFIPAGAGNTRQRPAQLPPRSVYPRWRGEHSVSRYISIPRNGLSPLARGTRIPDFSYGFTRRFIPAGAGNTRGVMAAAAAPPVYPRWRGEHWRGSRYVQIVRGLSPLARATPRS